MLSLLRLRHTGHQYFLQPLLILSYSLNPILHEVVGSQSQAVGNVGRPHALDRHFSPFVSHPRQPRSPRLHPCFVSLVIIFEIPPALGTHCPFRRAAELPKRGELCSCANCVWIVPMYHMQTTNCDRNLAVCHIEGDVLAIQAQHRAHVQTVHTETAPVVYHCLFPSSWHCYIGHRCQITSLLRGWVPLFIFQKLGFRHEILLRLCLGSRALLSIPFRFPGSSSAVFHFYHFWTLTSLDFVYASFIPFQSYTLPRSTSHH